MNEEYLAINFDTAKNPVEIMVIKYDKRTGELDFISDMHVCDNLIDIKRRIQRYMHERKLHGIVIDAPYHEREALKRI